MGRIAAVGEWDKIQAVALAGVEPHRAADPGEALAAWLELPADVSVLILTPQSESALAGRVDERRDLLVTVLP